MVKRGVQLGNRTKVQKNGDQHFEKGLKTKNLSDNNTFSHFVWIAGSEGKDIITNHMTYAADLTNPEVM